MAQKLFRDPLYDYITIDIGKHPWILDLINCPEVQRLRYINQLGLSHFTYTGSTHSRFSHSLGVFHIMRVCLEYLKGDYENYFNNGEEDALLAAILLHDIGHGPFSHATENLLGRHEERSVEIINSSESHINKVLRDVDKELPNKVVALIAKKIPTGTRPPPPWQRALISSQLDVDRLDFLRRDSLFSGAEYGNFDWYRIIHTMRLTESTEDIQKIIFWPDKTKYAIEEYLFSRFYMYQSVYFHHTTRGFEKLLQKILQRAQWIASQNSTTFWEDSVIPLLKPFLQKNNEPNICEFLNLTDYALLTQISEWRNVEDNILSDLANKFFDRKDSGFKVVREFDFTGKTPMITKIYEKEDNARQYLKKSGLDPEYYLLKDEFDVEVYKPYVPEFEPGIMSPENVITISDGAQIQEICKVLPRLNSIAKELQTARYYCPKEHKEQISQLLI